VAHLWKQEEQVRNVQEIANRGADLYDKFVGFVDDLGALGAQLDRTRVTYDAAMGKLATGRGNLVRQVEMLRTLGVQPTKRLPRQLTQRAEELDIFEDLNASGQITATSKTEESLRSQPDNRERDREA
jgi:DNA recombination protein RmuC